MIKTLDLRPYGIGFEDDKGVEWFVMEGIVKADVYFDEGEEGSISIRSGTIVEDIGVIHPLILQADEDGPKIIVKSIAEIPDQFPQTSISWLESCIEEHFAEEA
jgi:hypothetical protein